LFAPSLTATTGLKAAEQILKKNPKHGDTNAMKALILNSMGKQDEAMALGKLALTYDMKSQVCWHVYGLLYRSVKNYEEAIKAYKFALKLDPESQQIQRDLAHLQIQMRDYQGYIVSRRAMLQARSHIRQNWTALAIAHHLAGELAEAERTLTTYEETLKNPPPKTDLEHSEAVMYKNSIIAEQGDYERALEHLETAGKHNLDRLAVLELRAEYLSKLGRKEESVKAWRALIDRNSEHTTYYQGLAAALDIPESNHKELKAIFDEYAEKYPRSDAARRTPLNFLDGDDFKTAAQAYAKRMLDKGVPSTFANLKHLYASESKKQTLLDIVTEYITNNKERAEGEAKANGDTSKGNSSAFYYLAQHYNYYLSRDLDKALEFIDKAIELEPKSVDFHMTKARIFKHKGDTQKACELMELARTLDTRDRYINTKAAKYMLRNDENDRALKTLGMFTRAETPGGPLADLIDMQCQWYMAEDGLSHARQGHVGLALKRFQHVYNFFDTWQEDQFDFHSFSLRKGHVRAYVDMIRWEDKLREHPFFSRAAIGAIKEYIKLHDKPAASNGADDAEAELERKKAAKKAKKAAEKAAAEAASKEKPNAPKPAEGPVKKVDEDPNGEKLAATKTPLEDALKFLNPLLEFSPKLVEGQLLGFEVQLRRGKP
jgi:peptide alpha-N-acetyltransferase